jgi:hypothetical protein
MAERAAQIIGLDCVGVDVLAKDISLPLESSGLKVVEVNAAPGFRMHLEPTKGTTPECCKTGCGYALSYGLCTNSRFSRDRNKW